MIKISGKMDKLDPYKGFSSVISHSKRKKNEFIILTGYNHPLDYELDIYPFISGIVTD